MVIVVTITELKLNRWKVTFADTPHELVMSKVIHVTLAVTDCLIGLYRKVFILLYPTIVCLTTQASFLARKAYVTRFTQRLEHFLLLFQNSLLYPLVALVHSQLVSASEQRWSHSTWDPSPQ